MFSGLAKTEKNQISPKELCDELTGAGKGKKLCLVSDTRQEVDRAPLLAAHDFAISLLKDGWEVTLLDLNPYSRNKDELEPYRLIKLAGIFQEKNWYLPIQAFCVYQWLKAHDHDLVLFQYGFGAGYFCVMAKELALAFTHTPLIVLPDTPYAMWLEVCERFPSFETVRNDSEIDYMERVTVAKADALLISDPSVLKWMQSTEWPLTNKEKSSAILCDDGKQTKGEWFRDLTETKSLYKEEETLPLISVGIISNGKKAHLKELLVSLCDQTLQKCEVIVIDRSNAPQNLNELKIEYEKLFKKRAWIWIEDGKEKNEAVLRHKAATMASGSYIFFLDEDDVLMEDAIEIFSKALSSGKIDILTSTPGAHVNTDSTIGPLARLSSRVKNKGREISLGWIYYGANLVVSPFANVMGDASALFRRELFLDLHEPDEKGPNLFYGWDLLIKAANKGYEIHAVPEVLMLYRRDKNWRSIWTEGKFESQVKILAQIGKKVPTSLYAFLLPFFLNAYKGKSIERYMSPDQKEPIISYRAPQKIKPETKEDLIEIVLAADENYLMPLCVTIASIFSKTKGPLNITVISSLNLKGKAAVASVAKHYGGQIDFLEFETKKQNSISGSQMWGKHSYATYVRLWLADYFPDKKKILYLDCDIVVRHDLRDLWSYELGDHLLGAVRDPFVSKTKLVAEDFGGDYFNAGVLLINLDLWRAKDIGGKARHIMSALEDQNYPYLFHEQSPLNKAVCGNWLILPPTWNYSEDIDVCHTYFNLDKDDLSVLKADPALYHFRTSKKPWRPDADINSFYVLEYRAYHNIIERLLATKKETPQDRSPIYESRDKVSSLALPIVPLIYEASGAGKGRKLCLVSDCSRSKNAHDELIAKLKADGWQITILDLAASEDPDHFFKGVTYQRLAGLYKEKNWYIELQSLLTYHWLRSQKFDLVLFYQGFASAFYSVSAKRLELSLSETKIIVLLRDPHVLALEKKRRFPSARHDFEYDFMERKTIEGADALLLADEEILAWLIKEGWRLPKSLASLKYDLATGAKKWGEFISQLSHVSSEAKKEEKKDPIYISVCMATYNRPQWLKEALLALEKQTYKHFEVIIIDDGSEDGAVEDLRIELKPIFDARNWRWIKKENGGPALARNYAAEIARSDHLLFMDDDNIAYSDELERFAKAAEGGYDILTPILGMHPESELAFPATAQLPDREGKDIRPVGWTPIGGNLILAAFINVLGDTNSLFRREVFEKLGGFSTEKDVLFEDFDLLTRALIAGYKIEVIPEVLTLYRRTRNSRSMGGNIFKGHLSSLKPMFQLLPREFYPLLLAIRHEWYERHRGKSKERA